MFLKNGTDESIEIESNEGQLSPTTVKQFLKIRNDTGIGPIKMVCYINEDAKNDSNFVEVLGFIGAYNVLLDANKSERYHGLLLLGENKII